VDRRGFLRGAGAAALAVPLPAIGAGRAGARRRVVIVGGGYGGATAARYLRLLAPALEVVLVESAPAFVSCPLSNLVLGGFRAMGDITVAYSALEREGVRVVRDRALAVDPGRRQVRLARGDAIAFDRVVVAGGIDFLWEALPSLADEAARSRVLHAWKAGPQTAALRSRLEAMPDGGVFMIAIPEAPYRCPPGPYERACVVAAYFKAAKPRAKIVILDANEDVTSKGPLFKKAWAELYPGMIDYRPNNRVIDVDPASGVLKLDFGDEKADVVNLLPPMRAADVAGPFITANKRWCEVDWLTFESRAVPGVHVLGDSLQVAPLMPKSATMANAQAKTCAAALAAWSRDEAPNPAPTLLNACYSMVSATQAVHVASVHKFDTAERTFKVVPGAGGVSAAMSEAEGRYAANWALNIWADSLGATPTAARADRTMER
jgi:sulfide dehydrogenase [flavocytochrome c] flavoprotein chain